MSDTAGPITEPSAPASDFIRDIVTADVAAGRYPQIVTRFPPEPNGYLHLGHAKSICLNFGIARENGGRCNLRMDDTNPAKEDIEYVDSIREDVRWLTEGWADSVLGLKAGNAAPIHTAAAGKIDYLMPPRADSSTPGAPFYASEYFDALYDYAVVLIQKGKAYVCDLSPEDTEKYRGSPERPGIDSPFRNRSIEENISLFNRMRAGEFPDGTRTLRAKIDMASPNIWLRDPVLYRIRHVDHHHTGNRWRIYPMYDFAHCISDYIEGITHSICTLEFEVHRPLYDWILESLDLPRPLPHQYEFARLNLGYTVLSKRKLLELVQTSVVTGWDDPRMPTISGLRRRGVPASALRAFAQAIGVTKYNGLTDVAVFDHAIRTELNQVALRRLAVIRPLKLVLTNLEPGVAIEVDAVNNPENPALGSRKVQLTREVYIEKDDFMEVAPPKYFRLRPGGEVRLKYACIIRCDEVVKDSEGNLLELRCTADLDSRTGGPNSGKKVKGTIHWVSASLAVDAEVRLYDRLFTVEKPEEGGGDFRKHLNPASVEIVQAKLEPSLAVPGAGERYQFERIGYFWPDPVHSTPHKPVFNRIITMKDTWVKEASR
jgi:glutaminyl-tRNA synthetase